MNIIYPNGIRSPLTLYVTDVHRLLHVPELVPVVLRRGVTLESRVTLGLRPYRHHEAREWEADIPRYGFDGRLLVTTGILYGRTQLTGRKH